AQYLWVTSYYAKREAITLEKGEAGWKPWRYFGTLIAGGIALFVPGPWLVSYIFRYDFTASFLIFTALVNIHHFILDGAIWKLRDGRIAALLLNRRERSAEEGIAPAMGNATRWLRGSLSSTRALRVAAFSALLLWAGVDEARYYLGGGAQGISSLSLAARLDPYDSVVQMRLARAQSETGDYEASVAALRRAVATNPAEPAPQLELARAYIAHGSYAEAYAQYRKTLLLVPQDADALSNFGILAGRLGHGDEAIRSWQRALAADPAKADLHLYLAEVLQAQGNIADAASQYQAYLQWLAAHPGARPAPQKMITVLLRYAGVSAQMHQPEAAQRFDALAVSIAQQTHQPALESLAHAAIANVQARSGQSGAAALSYQQALALDAALPDRRSEAADWFNYGEFLRQQGQS
ncbi:MAG: tetratricopeptide repeat protein, partial [Steroidobacteraceae bacterium]